jgi:hypothetical protein
MADTKDTHAKDTRTKDTRTQREETRDRRRRGGMRAIAASLPRVTARAVGRRGLGEAGVIAHWAEIVGAELAAVCQPRRISYPRRDQRLDGALTLRVAPGHALAIQHLEPMILARINSHLGYAGVARLKLQQGPIAARRRRPAPPPAPDPAALAALDARLEGLEDPALAAALRRLGGALAAARRDDTQG